ncbi:DNA polymerase I [Rothia sp. ZJ932]|uniref:DNA polymerase I n=1 Tax=Rothia sp. ZJ932 TaxID=2810516 RepID=UPI0019685CA4|nr:DNA polymerase I [Rothia sp. ZJ932]QRZ60834.1 DNA polymerase I [Rothia sp. ZJ932]
MTSNTQEPAGRLLLIDGHSLAFRSFYGVPPESFQTSSGQYTNAVYSFLNTLLGQIKAENPTHIVVAFDLSGPTFRAEQYSEYKGGRNETPIEFAGQIELIQRALEALNIPWITKESYEADDIVATMTARGKDAGFEVLIISGDRDSFQLVGDGVTLLYPVTSGVSKGIRRMGHAEIQEKYKVAPHIYPDLAALTGEQADNLPGVPGVGPGFAAKWLNEYGDLQGVLENKDKIKGKKGEALRENVDAVLRNRQLNRLVDDLELEISLEDMDDFGPNHEALNELFDELEFNTIRKRVAETFAGREAEAAAQVDMTMGETQVITTAAELRTWLEGASAYIAAVERATEVPERLADAIVLHPVLDTDAPEAGNAHEKQILGMVLLAGAEPAWIDAVEISLELETALADWLADPAAAKIVFDVKSQYKNFAARGFELAGVVDDPMLSSYVCGFIPTAKQRSFTAMMQELSEKYLLDSFPQEEAETKPSQGDLFAPDVAVNTAYQGLVARFVLELAYALHADLVAQEQLALVETMELPLAKVLAEMERHGIALNTEVLGELKSYYDTHIQRAKEAAFAVIGHEVNLGSPKQLQAVLFEELDLPKTRKLKSGYSTDAESMADLLLNISPDSDGAHFLQALGTYRDYTKLKQTVEGLGKAVAADGRVHTTFQQNATTTGRLSSIEPNLQNIPIRTEEGRKIRDVFVVDPAAVDGINYSTLLTADYSQIEMRIMVHLSGDEKLVQAYRDGEDLHRFVGSQVFGVEPEEVTSEMRAKVKAMSYGLAYGLTKFGLSKQLGVSVEEASKLTVNYFQRFGKVGRFLRNTVKDANKSGYTETMFGRRRVLTDLGTSNRQRREAAERAALNAPIQGTAADIMKVAMLNVHERLRLEKLQTRMLLQVHDELILEVAPGEEEQAARLLEEEMSGAIELLVPLDVQAGTGASWHQAGH